MFKNPRHSKKTQDFLKNPRLFKKPKTFQKTRVFKKTQDIQNVLGHFVSFIQKED